MCRQLARQARRNDGGALVLCGQLAELRQMAELLTPVRADAGLDSGSASSMGSGVIAAIVIAAGT